MREESQKQAVFEDTFVVIGFRLYLYFPLPPSNSPPISTLLFTPV